MRKHKKTKGYEVPEEIQEILRNRKHAMGSKETEFTVRERTGEFRPPKLPRPNGDKVPVILGKMPPDQERNLIAEIEDDDGHVIFKRWKPTYPFYVGQMVSFWIYNVEYTYQIRSTDDAKVGEFVLVQKLKTERQPGVEARTSKRGGGFNSFAR